MNDLGLRKRRSRDAGVLMAIIVVAAMITGRTVTGADYFNGRDVYDLHCQGCHGADGVPLDPGSPDFSRGDAMFKSDIELFQLIRGGGGAMPAYRGLLDDDEIRDVITYVRSLQR